MLKRVKRFCNEKKKVCVGFVAVFLLCLVAIGICRYQTSAVYTAGKGMGSATAKIALDMVCEEFGTIQIEEMCSLKEAMESEDPVNYLVCHSKFIIDDEAVQKQVDALYSAMDLEARDRGMSCERMLTQLKGYESIQDYREKTYDSYVQFVKQRLAVYQAARMKHVSVTVHEYQRLLPEYAEKFGYKEAEAFERECDKDSIANEMLYDKTVEYLQAGKL